MKVYEIYKWYYPSINEYDLRKMLGSIIWRKLNMNEYHIGVYDWREIKSIVESHLNEDIDPIITSYQQDIIMYELRVMLYKTASYAFDINILDEEGDDPERDCNKCNFLTTTEQQQAFKYELSGIMFKHICKYCKTEVLHARYSKTNRLIPAPGCPKFKKRGMKDV